MGCKPKHPPSPGSPAAFHARLCTLHAAQVDLGLQPARPRPLIPETSPSAPSIPARLQETGPPGSQGRPLVKRNGGPAIHGRWRRGLRGQSRASHGAGPLPTRPLGPGRAATPARPPPQPGPDRRGRPAATRAPAQPPPRSAPGAQPPSRPNQRGQGREVRAAGGACEPSGVAGRRCARGRRGRSGAEAAAGRSAGRDACRGVCPVPLRRCRWFDPPTPSEVPRPSPGWTVPSGGAAGISPPHHHHPFPPPPGSAVGWPRPGSETRKALGAILGGTKQRRNTLPVAGVLWTPAYPVPLIL